MEEDSPTPTTLPTKDDSCGVVSNGSIRMDLSLHVDHPSVEVKTVSCEFGVFHLPVYPVRSVWPAHWLLLITNDDRS